MLLMSILLSILEFLSIYNIYLLISSITEDDISNSFLQSLFIKLGFENFSYVYGFSLLVLSLLIFILKNLYNYLSAGLIIKNIYSFFQNKFFNSLSILDYEKTVSSRYGKLLFNGTTSSQSIPVLVDCSLNIILNFIKIFVLAILLFQLSIYTLITITLTGFFLIIFSYKYYQLFLKKKSSNINLLREKQSNLIKDFLDSSLTIRVYNVQKLWGEKYKLIINQFTSLWRDIHFIKPIPSEFIGLLLLLILSIFSIFHSKGYLSNQINISLIITIYVTLSRLAGSFSLIISSYSTFIEYLPQFRSFIGTIEDQKTNTKRNNDNYSLNKKNTSLKKIHTLEFEQVKFKYQSNNNIIINNFNYTFTKGKSYLIHGSSGNGKSTILKLMLGLLKPSSGNIKINGSNIKDILDQSFFKLVGYMSQDTYLIHSSIKENVVFGRKYKKNDLQNVFIESNLIEIINKLENKDETIVGERGDKLSGGQKQRIGLARSLLNKPDLLILDEPTNNLDKNISKDLILNLKKLKKDKILIIVSHDTSLFDFCDFKISLR